MKKRMLSALLSLALIFTLSSVAIPASAASQPSNWAKALIDEAEGKGLITSDVSKDYQKAITREEYCGLIVTMVEKVLEKELPLPSVNPFSDTNSVYVQKAANYELVSGVGGGKYNPNAAITRQDYVYLLISALRKLEQNTGKTFLSPAAASSVFKDTNSISDYARDGVLIAFASGVVAGGSDGNFNPKNSIDCQSGVIAVLNGFNKIQSGTSSNSTTTPEFITIKGKQYSTNVEELNLSKLSLTNADIEPLKYLANSSVTSLLLHGNQISDLSPLEGLTQLKILSAGNNNNISDISPLKGLTQLTNLYLNENQISDISPLKGLTQLWLINLSKNQISDISPLKGLIQLTNLYLNDNQISDISPLSGLSKLNYVDLTNNHISDFSAVSHVSFVVGGSITLTRNEMVIKLRKISNWAVTSGLSIATAFNQSPGMSNISGPAYAGGDWRGSLKSAKSGILQIVDECGDFNEFSEIKKYSQEAVIMIDEILAAPSESVTRLISELDTHQTQMNYKLVDMMKPYQS